MSQTIEQKRAHYALQKANDWSGLNSNVRDKYLTLVPKIPTMILQNGLGQTLSYLLAEKSEASKGLCRYMQNWLCFKESERNEKPCAVYFFNNDENSNDINLLIEKVVSGSREDYMRAQQEALALFNWTKKFVKAKL